MSVAVRGCRIERRRFRGMGNETGQSLPALVEEMYFYLKKIENKKNLDCFKCCKGEEIRMII